MTFVCVLTGRMGCCGYEKCSFGDGRDGSEAATRRTKGSMPTFSGNGYESHAAGGKSDGIDGAFDAPKRPVPRTTRTERKGKTSVANGMGRRAKDPQGLSNRVARIAKLNWLRSRHAGSAPAVRDDQRSLDSAAHQVKVNVGVRSAGNSMTEGLRSSAPRYHVRKVGDDLTVEPEERRRLSDRVARIAKDNWRKNNVGTNHVVADWSDVCTPIRAATIRSSLPWSSVRDIEEDHGPGVSYHGCSTMVHRDKSVEEPIRRRQRLSNKICWIARNNWLNNNEANNRDSEPKPAVPGPSSVPRSCVVNTVVRTGD
jgi:hypothetical protein